MTKDSILQLHRSLVEGSVRPRDYAELASDFFRFDFSDQYTLTIQDGAQKVALLNTEKIELKPAHILAAILKYENRVWTFDELSQWAFIIYAQRDLADFNENQISEDGIDELIGALNQLSMGSQLSQEEKDSLIKSERAVVERYIAPSR